LYQVTAGKDQNDGWKALDKMSSQFD